MKNIPFPTVFWAAFCVTVLGALLKLLHLDFAYPILIVSLFLTLAYMAVGIYEVVSSDKANTSEKFMWAVGFIFFGFITGLVYIFAGRRRIVGTRINSAI